MNEPRFHVGQEVFVVHQTSRWRPEAREEYVRIAKIGKKYGYLEGQGREIDRRFSLSTGWSCDDGHNTRANGMGFDVYASREEYQKKQFAKTEHERLASRLIGGFRQLEPMSPQTVERIHKILDEEGLFTP